MTLKAFSNLNDAINSMEKKNQSSETAGCPKINNYDAVITSGMRGKWEDLVVFCNSVVLHYKVGNYSVVPAVHVVLIVFFLFTISYKT